MHRRILVLLAALFLAACANPPQRSADSPYYVLPEGSRLVLLQPIAIPHPGVSVWLQHGEVLGANRDRYQPACKLEMRNRPEQGRTVEPDTFEVKRVRREYEVVDAGSPYRYAAAQTDADSPMAYEMRTVIYLESTRQPEVFRLTCAHWDRPWFPQYLSLNQMSEALQGLFRIEPRQE